ncbi:MAG: hypothetical protein QOI12_3368 [Alphaproteobacteria bacterium]|jgi:lipoprotein-anchoring transpeptidase ErfK/SrfK|nr:hypothetical protein [Alphaproteobacteria bacterium]
MQRIAFPAVFTVLALTTASAGPLNLNPDTAANSAYAAARGAAQQPQPFAEAAPARPRQAAADGQNYGGGFLELLFRGPGPQPGAAPRYYEPQPAPQPERRSYRSPGDDQYENGPEFLQPARPSMEPAHPAVSQRFMRQVVDYDGREKPGTVIINTKERLLYLVQDDGKAIRYGIGVGRPGFTWAGVHHVSNKREWPDWTPPPEMLRRRPDLPRHMEGGPDNPLGARAMYLGSTLYRIHGSNEPWTIGQAVSSGCIRMRNDDVVDLYSKVKVGTKVVVI